MTRTLIIGGSAAGAAVAARLRRLDEHQDIVIYEKGSEISYASCGLPYYIGDVLPSRNSLIVTPVETFSHKYRTVVRTFSEVVSINSEKKEITVRDLKDGRKYTDTYDSLVIAAGASPVLPKSIKGIDLPQVTSLRTVDDAERIKKLIVDKKISSVVIAGGGFIGVELAENLVAMQVDTTIVELKSEVIGVFDEEFGRLMSGELRCNGVSVITETGITGFSAGSDDDRKIVAELSDGSRITADLVVMALGITPNTGFAGGIGLNMDSRGYILVNEYFETGIPGIYAAGDIVAVRHMVNQKQISSALAGPAARGARIISNRIAGLKDAGGFAGTCGSGIVKAFNLECAVTGFSEQFIQSAGLVKDTDYFTVMVTQNNHVGWYPGAKKLHIKGIFEKHTGRILGLEVAGATGTDKIVDVASALILKKGTWEDLVDLDLSYAPQFNAPKSPLNMLGFTAQNIALGLEKQIDVKELTGIIANRRNNANDNCFLLDVREPAEVSVYALPFFTNIPLGQLRERLGEIPQDKKVIITCAVGVRAWNAARILAASGIDTAVLTGGASFFRDYTTAIVKTDSDNRKKEHPKSHGVDRVNGRTDNDEVGKNIEFGKKEMLLDCRGLQCPGPIVKLSDNLEKIRSGNVDRIKVLASDPGFLNDVQAFVSMQEGVQLESCVSKDGDFEAVITSVGAKDAAVTGIGYTPAINKKQTIVVFSGDMDKVMASLVIANAALASGMEVTLFFTFWGLKAITRNGIKSLPLSKFNFLGLGRWMMKKVMRLKKISQPDELLADAMKKGVRIIACSMSMDVMNIKQEDLIPGVEIGGAAQYLAETRTTGNNLFIS